MRRFSAKLKREAFERCRGCCEACGRVLVSGDVHYDHVIPFALSVDSGDGNIQVLCRTCHKAKTIARDVPVIAHVKRLADARKGLRQRGRPMPAGKASSLKKTLAGAVVPRVTQAEAHRALMAERYGQDDWE